MARTVEMETEFSDGEAPQATKSAPATSIPAYGPPAALAARGNSAGTLLKGKEEKELAHLPGYIFMCNRRTKPECYQYRVFGLPKGRKDIVEKIKPGMKLFLYDFEGKLLYGIYEATTSGMLDIEPSAFDGKYPAQVGFRIYRDCYPLSESYLKPAILDNYIGSKFKQELSAQQVMNLLSLFRSFSTPELESKLSDFATVNSPSARKLSGIDNDMLHPQTRVLSFEERYIAERRRQRKHASSVLDPQFICEMEPLNYSRGRSLSMVHNLRTNDRLSLLSHRAQGVSSLQRSYYGETANAKPTIEPQTMLNHYQQQYSSEKHRQHLLGGPPKSSALDPHLKYLSILSNIRRYGTAQEPVSTDQLLALRDCLKPSQNEKYASVSTRTGYHPSAVPGNECYPLMSSGNEHHPSTISANEHYPSAVSGNEYYPSTSQRDGEAVQQPEIPAANHNHHQPSTALNAVEPMQSAIDNMPQSYAEATAYASQPHAEATAYTPQSLAEANVYAPQPHAEAIAYVHHPYAEAVAYSYESHAEAVAYIPQSHAGAIVYNPQSHSGAIAYDPQSHAGAMANDPQSHAGAIAYDPQSHAGAIAYDPQSNPGVIAYDPKLNPGVNAFDQLSHPGVNAYNPQSHPGINTYDPHSHARAIGYATQSHAEAVAYDPQSHAGAFGYAPQSHAGAVGYPSQSHAEAVGCAQHNSLLGACVTGEGNVSNPYDYSYTAGTTTSYNQTC